MSHWLDDIAVTLGRPLSRRALLEGAAALGLAAGPLGRISAAQAATGSALESSCYAQCLKEVNFSFRYVATYCDDKFLRHGEFEFTDYVGYTRCLADVERVRREYAKTCSEPYCGDPPPKKRKKAPAKPPSRGSTPPAPPKLPPPPPPAPPPPSSQCQLCESVGGYCGVCPTGSGGSGSGFFCGTAGVLPCRYCGGC